MLVSLVQVGDMRAAWKKMKAAGVTSDMGLRYAYVSGERQGVLCHVAAVSIPSVVLNEHARVKKLMPPWLLFLKMSISHFVSHTALVVPSWLYSLHTGIGVIACATLCHADGIVDNVHNLQMALCTLSQQHVCAPSTARKTNFAGAHWPAVVQ